MPQYLSIGGPEPVLENGGQIVWDTCEFSFQIISEPVATMLVVGTRPTLGGKALPMVLQASQFLPLHVTPSHTNTGYF